MRILVVEGEAFAAESLARELRWQGYEVACVGTGAEALDVYRRVDLVLLGLELPDVDGLQVCRGIRRDCAVPIIAITTRNTELDRVLGLQAGADDYLAKPYGFRELVARIEAVMRRVCSCRTGAQLAPDDEVSGADGADTMASGPLFIDAQAREVRVGETVINLTRKEFDLLRMLASRPRAVVSRRELMSTVWGDEWGRPTRTIDTHVNSLRNKLGASSWIVTVRGVGFRLGSPPSNR